MQCIFISTPLEEFTHNLPIQATAKPHSYEAPSIGNKYKYSDGLINLR